PSRQGRPSHWILQQSRSQLLIAPQEERLRTLRHWNSEMCVLSIYNDRNSVFEHRRHRAALSNDLPGRCSNAIINEGEKLTYSAGDLLTKRQKTESPPV